MTKIPTTWANNDVKVPDSWSQALKTPSLFRPQLNPGQPYQYDSSTMTYDSAFVLYDRLVNGNQINQLISTMWTQD